MLRRLPIVALALLVATSLHAQQRRVRIDPDIRKSIITLNPFAIFAEYLTGDIEVKVAPMVTVGAGGSFAGGNFESYRTLEAKVRYYPAEKALLGFSVAATLGVGSAMGYEYGNTQVSNPSERRLTLPSVGTELSYQWILGPSARFVAVSGLGLKRFFGGTNNSADILGTPVVPTARINIGVAF